MKNIIFKRSMIMGALLALCFGFTAYGNPYEAGTSGDASTFKKGEVKYSEVVFVSGEAILLTGKATIVEDTSGKLTFTATLANVEKKATLSRKFVFTATDEDNSTGGQTLRTISLSPGFTESIKVDADTYTLSEYYFSGSSVVDKRAVINYKALSWNGRKEYSKSGQAEALVVDINAENNAYSSDWSKTEVSLMDMQYTWNTADATTGVVSKKVGTAKVAVSETKTKLIEYIGNSASSMSFGGGYTVKQLGENTITWKSDLPSGASTSDARKKEKSSIKVTTVPTVQRYFIPIIRDVAREYWAYDAINKMASLDIITTKENKYFRPLLGVSKAEFAKAMVKVGALKTEGIGSVSRLPYGVKFTDVPTKHPFAKYIFAAINTEMMDPATATKFAPESYITRSYAVKTIVGAFGFENNSTESEISTPFEDDDLVPADEKKTMNIAYRMGIITPDDYNRIDPDQRVTRAEAVDMIYKLVKYLEYDIKKDYKDKVIDFVM